MSYYGPLRRLTRSLWLATVACLLASFSQLTIGLVQERWAAIMCISAAGVAMILLLVVLAFMQLNLRKLFKFIEAERAEKPQPTETVTELED